MRLVGSQLWIVGRLAGAGWEFMGVFSEKDLAIKACSIPDRDFIAPADIDIKAPEERRYWPGSYYPLAETEEEAAARVAELPNP